MIISVSTNITDADQTEADIHIQQHFSLLIFLVPEFILSSLLHIQI